MKAHGHTVKLSDIKHKHVYQLDEYFLMALSTGNVAVLFILVDSHKDNWTVVSFSDCGKEAVEALIVMQAENVLKYVFIIMYLDSNQKFTHDYRVVDNGLTDILDRLHPIGFYEDPLELDMDIWGGIFGS